MAETPQDAGAVDRDFAAQAPSAGAAARAGASARPFTTEPYNPSRDRETTRGKIAMGLVWTLIGLVGATFALAMVVSATCAIRSCPPDAVKLDGVRLVVELLLTPIVGLVGAVTGFYFGEKSGKPE
jgi:hypothetical protein